MEIGDIRGVLLLIGVILFLLAIFGDNIETNFITLKANTPKWQRALLGLLGIGIFGFAIFLNFNFSAVENPPQKAPVNETLIPTSTAEPPTIADRLSVTAISVQSEAVMPPAIIPNVTLPNPTATTPPLVSPVDNLQLTIFRDEDSFTILVPADSNVSGLTYQVTLDSGVESYIVERYLGFIGLPFSSLPQNVCFRLVRTGSTRPVPQICQGETLLLKHQLAATDVFWRDLSTGLDRTVLIYQGTTLLGACGAGQKRCVIDNEVMEGGVDIGTYCGSVLGGNHAEVVDNEWVCIDGGGNIISVIINDVCMWQSNSEYPQAKTRGSIYQYYCSR